MIYPLFDTHTHFDLTNFDEDRLILAQLAKQRGVEQLILIGIEQTKFTRMIEIHHQLSIAQHVPKSHIALGLHPMYISNHQKKHIDDLAQYLKQNQCLAIGEIGLDYYLAIHNTTEYKLRQIDYFNAQLELATLYQKPVLLHFRKAHADGLKRLKQHQFKQGGIVHSFSGGIEEAKAFIQLGFKIGITGQITNPNAKKLRTVVHTLGVEHLVIETDCPDMTPLCCQLSSEVKTRNTPANLPFVLQGLSQVLQQPIKQLATTLWQNSLQCLHL